MKKVNNGKIIINKEKEKIDNNSFIIDAAVFFALASSVLFFMAYLYEERVLEYFGISISFIEIGYSTILEYSTIIFLFLGILFVYEYFLKVLLRVKNIENNYLRTIFGLWIPIIYFNVKI
jgi:hypothetical protein